MKKYEKKLKEVKKSSKEKDLELTKVNEIQKKLEDKF